MTRLRLASAHAAGLLAGRLSAALGRGRGETLHGRVLLAIEPDALRLLSRDRRIILVSGTNGKTTTTGYLTHLLARASGQGISTSQFGANMTAGIASALARSPRHRLAVLECDEMYLPNVMAQVQPEVVVLLNLSRDQLHRTGEVRKVAALWHDALAGSGATVIIDRDDPFLDFAGNQARAVVRVGFGGRQHADGATCPACGRLLDWSLGDYRCPCGLGTGPVDVLGPSGLTGPQRNAVLAVAAVRALGYGVDEATEGLAVASAPDRVTDFEVNGTPLTTRLAKNPESWRGALTAVQAPVVVLAVNARGIDGRDMSWVWDVDFSPLHGRTVVCTGDRRLDVAYRLSVQGIDVSVQPTVGQSVAALAREHVGAPVEAIASYTAFQDLAAAADGIHATSGGRL